VFVIGEMTEFKQDVINYRTVQHEVKIAKDLQLRVANIWQFFTDASLTKDRKVIDEEAKPNLDLAYKDIEKIMEIDKDKPEHIKKLEAMKADLSKLWETGNKMYDSYVADWQKGNAVMEEYDKICDKVIQGLKPMSAEKIGMPKQQ
jgi:methyl-accepting chemotaxis protein